MYILLAKTYIKRNKLDELVLLSQELIENNEIDLKQYLEKVENALYGEIASKEKLLRKNPNMILTSTIDKIKELSEAIRQHQEMQGRFLSNNRNTNDDILKERISQIYDSEIYNCLTSEQDNHIHLSNIRPYIDNLDITLDDRLLLYLSAARVLFMNKFPKQAEQYLQLVERTPDKSEKIKEEYDRCQKNKKLYLNK